MAKEFDRTKLKPPRPIPKVNKPKIEAEMEEWIGRILTKMRPIVFRTQYKEIVDKFRGGIRPIFSGGIDYGRLPYGNIGAVQNRVAAECLFSMLARIYMYWWDFLIGNDKVLKLCKVSLEKLEEILDNYGDYELRNLEKNGYRLCKKSKKSKNSMI